MNTAIMSSEVVDNDEELVYTIDEALTVLGFGRFQALVLAYAGLGAMAEAMEVMILSFIGPSVKAEWGLSSGQESLITTVVFAGMLIGAYAWGIISDNYGRRMGLLSIAVVTSIFAILSVFAPNYISLVIFRMVVGIGLGGGPVYSSWFLEFVPMQNRGMWMVVFSTFWTIGTIFEASLAWIIMPRLGWRWLLALSSVPCLAAFILYFFTVESPRYLYLKGRTSDAQNVLKKMASINSTELPSGILVSDKMSELDEELTTSENTELLSTMGNKSTSSNSGFSSLFTLLSSTLIKTTLLMWVIYFANSFLYYGVVLMTSEFSSRQSKCGAIVIHSNQLTDSSLYQNVFITSFAELPGLILSAILVDKVGRRISLVLMYAFSFIFLLPLMLHQNELLTTSLLFGARMCLIGTYTVAGIYCPELYPTSIRTTGVGVASAVGRIAGMICPYVAVELVSGCHQMAAISLFEAVMILSGTSVLLFKVETKGRQLNDIVAVHN
ncbi:organic cation/carnitine transporter 7 isoform X2 [Sesamum indicum]|uniref:Organic cation/carnitine transporter 7 isoform X2 n=1 Tax=Sesamum indicum TaxID=4182 RepID=A0A6I9UI23_SESIN|nr:organic cation/carnitine transporter 7 isoform X2 [Sesamum indicum]